MSLNFLYKLIHERGIAIHNALLDFQMHLFGGVFGAAHGVGANAMRIRRIEAGDKVSDQRACWFLDRLEKCLDGTIGLIDVYAVQDLADNVPNFDFGKLAVFEKAVFVSNGLQEQMGML